MEDWYTIFNGGIWWAYLSIGNHFCVHLEVEYFLCKLASHGNFGTQLVWTGTAAWDWPLYHGQAWFALSLGVTLAWKKLTNCQCWSSTYITFRLKPGSRIVTCSWYFLLSHSSLGMWRYLFFFPPYSVISVRLFACYWESTNTWAWNQLFTCDFGHMTFLWFFSFSKSHCLTKILFTDLLLTNSSVPFMDSILHSHQGFLWTLVVLNVLKWNFDIPWVFI